MSEVDDRLAGDPVWELFPRPFPRPARRYFNARDCRRWLAVACVIAVGWLLFPPYAVLTACLAVSTRDFRTGRQLARSIPDKAGGTICARFTYAWGAWKIGLTAFVMTLLLATAFAGSARRSELFIGLLTSELLWLGGFTASAALTAAGLVRAHRTGMRVWIGEGVNKARTRMARG
jgi:hypothetical protein